MIEKEEIDRETTSLWPVHVDVWEGFVFVNLSREEPRPLLEHLADQQDDALGLARVGLRSCASATSPRSTSRPTGRSSRELQRVPALPDHPPRAGRRRAGLPEGRHLRPQPRRRRRDARRRPHGDGHRPAAAAPLLPGFRDQGDPSASTGRMVYPAVFLDVDGSTRAGDRDLPDRPAELPAGDGVPLQSRGPRGPRTSTRPRWVELDELVTRQDNEACERVQRGVTSRAFDHGVFPEKDFWVHGFRQRFLHDEESATWSRTRSTRPRTARFR